MSLTLTEQKKIEKEQHELLYYNIEVLTMEFPTSENFNKCLKKDMFTKNNKTAFQQVIHFLLNIYDPTLFKQKIQWPVLDIKMETEFRNEVMKYCNELATTNKDSGIPLLMLSHVISPGGHKFVNFMYKLSQFVLFDHLQKDQDTADEMILNMTIDNDPQIGARQLSNLNKLVDYNTYNLAITQAEFHEKFNAVKQNFEEIAKNKEIIDNANLDIKYQLREIHQKVISELKTSGAPTLESLNNKVEIQLQNLSLKEEMFNKCAKLVDVINSNCNVLRYEKYSGTSDNSINLVEYLESLYNNLSEKKHIAQVNYSMSDFANELNLLDGCIDTLQEYYGKYELLDMELINFSNYLEEKISELENETIFNENPELREKIRRVFVNEMEPFVNIETCIKKNKY